MVDYKEQVLIIGIKSNIQCPICYVLSKKRKKVTKSEELQTCKLTWEQLKRQVNNLVIESDKAADS